MSSPLKGNHFTSTFFYFITTLSLSRHIIYIPWTWTMERYHTSYILCAHSWHVAMDNVPRSFQGHEQTWNHTYRGIPFKNECEGVRERESGAGNWTTSTFFSLSLSTCRYIIISQNCERGRWEVKERERDKTNLWAYIYIPLSLFDPRNPMYVIRSFPLSLKSVFALHSILSLPNFDTISDSPAQILYTLTCFCILSLSLSFMVWREKNLIDTKCYSIPWFTLGCISSTVTVSKE